MCIYIYIHIYIYILPSPGASRRGTAWWRSSPELCYAYPCPCQNKFYKLQTVPFVTRSCSANSYGGRLSVAQLSKYITLCMYICIYIYIYIHIHTLYHIILYHNLLYYIIVYAVSMSGTGSPSGPSRSTAAGILEFGDTPTKPYRFIWQCFPTKSSHLRYIKWCTDNRSMHVWHNRWTSHISYDFLTQTLKVRLPEVNWSPPRLMTWAS